MGTEKAEELQETIKEACKRVGWSQKELARQLYCELNDSDNETEIRQFEERLKKELSRPTTKPERLMYYLDILRGLPEIEKAGLVIPQYHSSRSLPRELERALVEVSADISKRLRDEYD